MRAKTTGVGLLLALLVLSRSAAAEDAMDALTPRERALVAVARHTAHGDMPKLKTALNAGADYRAATAER